MLIISSILFPVATNQCSSADLFYRIGDPDVELFPRFHKLTSCD